MKEVELEPNHRSPLPLLYCLASIKARPVVQNSHNWKFSERPIHWCYILSSQDITLEGDMFSVHCFLMNCSFFESPGSLR